MTRQILVIDDEAALRELVATCLEDIGGWMAVTAASGAKGLYKAGRMPIDAILLDVSMPDLDGFQCYKALKTNVVTQAIPIILLTAKALADDRDQLRQLDIAGIIIKPFDPLLICDQIAEILNWNK